MSEFQAPELPRLEVIDEATHHQQLLDEREAARRQGYAEGIAEAQAQVAGALQALRAAEAQRREDVRLVCRRLEAEAVDLALAIAAHLLPAVSRDHPEALLLSTREALDYVREAEQVHLYLHPDDLAQIETHLAGDDRLRFHPDPELTAGGLRVETEIGDVDADRASRLAAVAGALRAHREERMEDDAVA